MVQLKEIAEAVFDCVQKFQFHYGTIKSSFFGSQISGFKRFQFHYGTIKRTGRFASVIVAQYFNSTMVQLKVVAIR